MHHIHIIETSPPTVIALETLFVLFSMYVVTFNDTLQTPVSHPHDPMNRQSSGHNTGKKKTKTLQVI